MIAHDHASVLTKFSLQYSMSVLKWEPLNLHVHVSIKIEAEVHTQCSLRCLFAQCDMHYNIRPCSEVLNRCTDIHHSSVVLCACTSVAHSQSI